MQVQSAAPPRVQTDEPVPAELSTGLPPSKARHTTVTIPAPKNPTQAIDCPRGCGATIHRTDWDDNHGWYHHPRHIDPQELTQQEAIACIIAGRPIYTWRTDRHRRHWHGAQSPWHPATRHAPAHRCGHTFPETAYGGPELAFELTPPDTDMPF